jgi:hypothetical protein
MAVAAQNQTVTDLIETSTLSEFSKMRVDVSIMLLQAVARAAIIIDVRALCQYCGDRAECSTGAEVLPAPSTPRNTYEVSADEHGVRLGGIFHTFLQLA